MADGVKGDAIFSECGRHRILLARTWVARPTRWLLWIGMNPSTAGFDEDDPTVQRECTRTRNLGYDGYLKANVLDYRATKPRHLTAPGVTANSAANHPTILRVARLCEAVVMAHGNLPKPFADLAVSLTEQLEQDGHRLLCLGLNQNGTPKHPLYLRADTAMIAYRPTALGTAERKEVGSGQTTPTGNSIAPIHAERRPRPHDASDGRATA